MTELRCTCGAVLDGIGEELLDAVETHLDDEHRGRLRIGADESGDSRARCGIDPLEEEER
jgi:hypothetical protein